MSEGIRVTVRRSGGFTGIQRTFVKDTEHLDGAEAERLRALVGDVDEAVTAEQVAPPPGADRLQYDVTIERGSGHVGFRRFEGAMEPQLKALVDDLVRSGGSAGGTTSASPGASEP